MSNVINIRSKEYVTEMPASKEDGNNIIAHLYKLRPDGKEPNRDVIELVSDLVSIIEGNTGASRFEALKQHLEEKQKKV